MKQKQTGNTFVGIIIGVVVGLAAALAVAVYVTKVPVPFLNKGPSRSAEQDAAESRKNQNWDPNAPLYGKNPAKPLPPAPGVAASAPGAPSTPSAAATPAQPGRDADKARDKEPVPPALAGLPAPADPLGELATAKASPGSDPFIYFVQAGAFRTSDDAEAQRAKLSLMGVEAKVTEREQSGRQVYRVRVGPFSSKDDADRQKERLDQGGFETALVRVQR
ncbi:SPOR domain-containing protein [Ramlibacter alkalitolerans]